MASCEVVARFTEKNIGIGLFPNYLLKGNRYPAIVPYPLNIPPMEYEIRAIYPKGDKLSRAACAFIEQCILSSAA